MDTLKEPLVFVQDDVSHCAVFGDEQEQNDEDILDDEDINPKDGTKRPSVGSTGSGSSSSEGPETEDPPVMLDLKNGAKIVASDANKNEDDEDPESSSSEEADIKPPTNGKDAIIEQQRQPQIDLLGGELDH